MNLYYELRIIVSSNIKTQLWYTVTWPSFVLQEEDPEPCVLNFIDGIVIIVVVTVISAITAVNNYIKELQFCQLQSKQDDSRVTVWRSESVTQVSVVDICVGDVVQLDTGSKIPAGI